MKKVKILTGDEEIVIFDGNDTFEIIEHYYNNIFMGFNLMLGNMLIDTYDDEDEAVMAMSVLCNKIDNNVDYIDIDKINNLLEI